MCPVCPREMEQKIVKLRATLWDNLGEYFVSRVTCNALAEVGCFAPGAACNAQAEAEHCAVSD